MTTIQPVAPIVNTASATGAGGNGKADAGNAADFLSMVIGAAGEEPAGNDAAADVVAEPTAEQTDEDLAQSMESAIAAGPMPAAVPAPLPIPAGEIDIALDAPADALPVSTPLAASVTAGAQEDALAVAAKAKAVNDVLLQAQAPAPNDQTPVDAAAPDAQAQSVAPSDGEETKPMKDQATALPGSLLSMKETPEPSTEALPAALAFRKALDQRTQNDRTREATAETARSESNGAPRAEARSVDADAALRVQAQAQTSTVPNEGEGETKPLDPLVRHAGGESAFDSLLAGKSGEAKQAGAAAALTAVKGVVVNPQAVVAQVAVQLTAAGKAKTQAMTVKLEPVELGKIDIRLDFGTDGKVQASIIADRPQTLDMLQRDARGLEKALQSAGLQTDSGSLSFNLRGQDQQQAQGDQRRRFSANGDDGDAVFASESFSVIAGQPRTAPLGRVDMLL